MNNEQFMHLGGGGGALWLLRVETCDFSTEAQA